MCSLVIVITIHSVEQNIFHLPWVGALKKANHFTMKQLFLADVRHVLINTQWGSKVLTDILVLGYSKA